MTSVKKNKVLNFITMLVLLPMLLLSIFVPLNSRKIQNVSAYSTNNTNSGFVDTLPIMYASLASFGSPIIPINNEWFTLQFSFNFSTAVNSSGATTYSLTLNGVNNSGTEQTCCSLLSTSSMANNYGYYKLGFSGNGTSTYNVTNLSVGDNKRYLSSSEIESDYRFPAVFDMNITLTTNFNYRDIYLMSVRSFYNESSSYGYNEFTYYSSSSDYLRFRFYSYFTANTFNEHFYLTSHDYYFVQNLTDNQYYKDGYNTGVDEGYKTGYYEGNNVGYSNGYKQGETVGYNNGYNVGIEKASDYSFLSLMGAVIDAPVSAFTSLLNFELLGINLLSFITGLLTLAIIIFIIKLILGGK